MVMVQEMCPLIHLFVRSFGFLGKQKKKTLELLLRYYICKIAYIILSILFCPLRMNRGDVCVNIITLKRAAQPFSEALGRKGSVEHAQLSICCSQEGSYSIYWGFFDHSKLTEISRSKLRTMSIIVHVGRHADRYSADVQPSSLGQISLNKRPHRKVFSIHRTKQIFFCLQLRSQCHHRWIARGWHWERGSFHVHPRQLKPPISTEACPSPFKNFTH